MNQKEVEEIKKVLNDDYVQSVVKMSDSHIGGQIRYVMALFNSPTMPPSSGQSQAEKLTNGCILKTATEYLESMPEEAKEKLARHFKIGVDDLTPYHLVKPVEAAVLDILNKLTGAVTFAQYANQKGYEDLITTIRSVGRKPRFSSKPSYLDRVLTPQINNLK